MNVLSYLSGCCYLLAVYAYYLFKSQQKRWYRHVGWLLALVGMLIQGVSFHASLTDLAQPLSEWLFVNMVLWLVLVWLLWRSVAHSNTTCLVGCLLLLVWLGATDALVNHPLSQLASSFSVLKIHIILATLTSVILLGVGVQAVMVLLQERLLRKRPGAGWLKHLPSLHTMERCLFSMLALGVGALTLCVVTSGFFFVPLIPANALWLSKLIIVWVAWVIFSVVLAGHYWFGWRAPQVSLCTIVAVCLLVLVYLGSQLLLG
mgnify:CR=1 FL=1